MTAFESTVTDIIQKSILSSVYIDDKIVEPFSPKTDDNSKYYDVSKGLYDSFKNAKKSLDFYQYKSQKNWSEDIPYLFKSRDLVILDWQLNDDQGLKQIETLRILNQAVQTESLHFISVYTEETRLEHIFYSIKSFFNPLFTNETKKKIDDLVNQIDEQGIDAQKIFSENNDMFFRIALEPNKQRKETIKELKNRIREALGNEYRLFAKSLKKIDNDVSNVCEVLGYIVNGEPITEKKDFKLAVNVDFITENFIVINNTIIQITNKKKPEPENLFLFFTEAVQKVCGNLLTLISIEVRNLLRESSGFIGKEAKSIKDEILFDQQRRKEGFFDFLMTIIKNNTLSYFDYKQDNLKSVTTNFWNEYYKSKGIATTHSELDNNNDQMIEEIKKLNVYYNILHVKKQPDSLLSFGDVFYSIKEGKKDGHFFLCITAHCDCFHPKENIKNNFFFIRGEKDDNIKLVEKGDDVFCSYVPDDSGILVINWYPRPIILNLGNARFANY